MLLRMEAEQQPVNGLGLLIKFRFVCICAVLDEPLKKSFIWLIILVRNIVQICYVARLTDIFY